MLVAQPPEESATRVAVGWNSSGNTDGYNMLILNDIDIDIQLISIFFQCCVLICALVESSTHYMFEII